MKNSSYSYYLVIAIASAIKVAGQNRTILQKPQKASLNNWAKFLYYYS